MVGCPIIKMNNSGETHLHLNKHITVYLSSRYVAASSAAWMIQARGNCW